MHSLYLYYGSPVIDFAIHLPSSILYNFVSIRFEFLVKSRIINYIYLLNTNNTNNTIKLR